MECRELRSWIEGEMGWEVNGWPNWDLNTQGVNPHGEIELLKLRARVKPKLTCSGNFVAISALFKPTLE